MYADVIETVGTTIDAIGVAVIAGGLVYALVVAARGDETQLGRTRYVRLRQAVGRSILLGLELSPAAGRGRAPSPRLRQRDRSVLERLR